MILRLCMLIQFPYPLLARLVFAALVCSGVSILLTGCGQAVAPDGGPPDKTPPMILRTIPERAARNVQPQSIVIEFSKYISKQQFPQNLFLSPQIPYKLSWSGKTLDVELQEALDTNTTYALTIGSDYADWRGNKPEKSFTLMFSTGNDLDSGTIRGTVYMPDYSTLKQEGVYVFVYRLPELQAERDTFDIRTHRPKYRTQPGKDGSFEVPALAEGIYRVAVVKDEFRDGMLDDKTDGYGLLTSDVVLAPKATAIVRIRLDKAYDTRTPQLVSATALSNHIVRVRFSKRMDSLTILPERFQVFDSTNTERRRTVIAAHSVPSALQTADVYLKEDGEQQTRWRITATALRDSAGNAVNDTANTVTITYPGTEAGISVVPPDTVTPKLLHISIADSAQHIALQPTLRLVWSQAILPSTRKNLRVVFTTLPQQLTISATQAQISSVQADPRQEKFPSTTTTGSRRIEDSTPLQSMVIPTTSAWLTANVMAITPQLLSPITQYHITVTTAGVRSMFGQAVRDTVVQHLFRTIDTGPFGSVIGTLRDSAFIAEKHTTAEYIVILQTKDKQTTLLRRIKQPGRFEFTDVPAGGYTLYGFYDTDGNGYHTAGQCMPFRPAERFAVVPGEIMVRQRWSMEGVILNFSILR